MKKILLFLFVLLIALGLSGLLVLKVKDEFVKGKMKHFFSQLTGAPVEVGNVKVDNRLNRIHIDEIRIFNPPKFDSMSKIVSIQAIEIEVDPLIYLRDHQIRFGKVQAAIKEFNVDYTREGTNLGEMPSLKLSGAIPVPTEKEKNHPSFLIEQLTLKFFTLNYTDKIKQPEEKQTVQFDGKEELYEYVTDSRVLIQAPALKAVHSLGRGSLGLPLGLLQQNVGVQTGKPLPVPDLNAEEAVEDSLPAK